MNCINHLRNIADDIGKTIDQRTIILEKNARATLKN